MIRAAAALLVLAGPAAADPVPLLRLEAADGAAVEAGLRDVAGWARTDGALDLRLDPALDGAVAALSRGRVGQRLTLRICGQPVLAPVLQEDLTTALFRIAGDAARIDWAETALRAPDCTAVTPPR